MAQSLATEAFGQYIEAQTRQTLSASFKKRSGELTRDSDNLPVLVDHVSDSKPVVNNLAPTEAIQILKTELRSREDPSARVSIRRVAEYGRCLLICLQKLLQSEQMAVRSLAIRCGMQVLNMRSHYISEQLNVVGGIARVVGGNFSKGDRIIRN